MRGSKEKRKSIVQLIEAMDADACVGYLKIAAILFNICMRKVLLI